MAMLRARTGDCAPGLVYDAARATAAHGTQEVELTRNENRILQTLLDNRGSIVSREALMTTLWEDDTYVDENTLTVNVARLRRKLADIGLVDLIETARGRAICCDRAVFLREAGRLAALVWLALAACIFALVLHLYRAPVQAALYAGLICLVLLCLAGGADYARYFGTAPRASAPDAGYPNHFRTCP